VAHAGGRGKSFGFVRPAEGGQFPPQGGGLASLPGQIGQVESDGFRSADSWACG
jgi:hypothetical protein